MMNPLPSAACLVKIRCQHQYRNKNSICYHPLRITGEAELTKELEVKKKVIEKFPFLKPLLEKEGYDILAPYYIREAKALVWTMETTLAPKGDIEL